MNRKELIENYKYNTEYILKYKMSDKRLKQIDGVYPLFGFDEIFVRHPDWKDYYISSYGRVISKKPIKDGFKYKLLKITINNKGYVVYGLSCRGRFYKGNRVKYGDFKPITAQKLVADIFCPNFFIGEEIEIHHINKKKDDNYYKNLAALNFPKHHEVNYSKSIRIVKNGRFYNCSLYDLMEKTGMTYAELIPDDSAEPDEKTEKYSIFNIGEYTVAYEDVKIKEKIIKQRRKRKKKKETKKGES